MKIFNMAAVAAIISALLLSGCGEKSPGTVQKEVKPVETNAAQKYIDTQKKSIEKAQEAVDKNNKAQEEALRNYEDIK